MLKGDVDRKKGKRLKAEGGATSPHGVRGSIENRQVSILNFFIRMDTFFLFTGHHGLDVIFNGANGFDIELFHQNSHHRRRQKGRQCGP